LCAPGDPQALAKALGPLLASPDARARAGAAARVRAEQRLSWDRHVDAVEGAARGLLAVA
jgi:hypothetical protein